MTRLFAFLSAVSAAATLVAGEELPKSDDIDSLDIEPPLLIPNLVRDKAPIVAKDAPAPILDPDRLEIELERAKKNAKSAERLFKIGVLAKAEAEQRVLRVARLQSDLETARLTRAKEQLAAQQSRLAASEISQAELSEAETALGRATEASHAAAAARARAELDAAQSNLDRQRKLLVLGSGRKSEVSRAEEKLAELKAPKE
jgi:multidrug efflux pump subunit AcrA (membrane-fusion protein)